MRKRGYWRKISREGNPAKVKAYPGDKEERSGSSFNIPQAKREWIYLARGSPLCRVAEHAESRALAWAYKESKARPEAMPLSGSPYCFKQEQSKSRQKTSLSSLLD